MKTTLPDEVKKLLEKTSAVLMGSRGLYVADSNSNYDIAIHNIDLPSNIHEYEKGIMMQEFPLLAFENACLYKKGNINLIAYMDWKHIAVVRSVMFDLLRIPKYLLRGKFTRGVLFESALEHYKFEGGKYVEIR